MHKGKIFVFSGCSGVGKSSVLGKVMEARKDLSFSVSATTRAPRPNEVEGVHYNFVTRETFREMIDRDAFVEYDEHMGNFYGTPRAQLEEKMEKGHAVLDIEPNGAFRVKKTCPEAVLIFLVPPDLETLEKRLGNRGDTDPEQIALRQARYGWEMEQSEKYDYVVINDVLDDCVRDVLDIISREEK